MYQFFSTDALMEYTNGDFVVTGENATANIFASYPAKHVSVLNGFVDQVRLKANDELCVDRQHIWRAAASSVNEVSRA